MMKKYLLIAALFFTTPAFADSTIDALSAAAALAGTENVPIFQTANPAVKTTTGAIGNAGALTGDVTKAAGSSATTLATGNAGNLNSGTLNAARMPALTGDCTTSAGSVATTCTKSTLSHPGYKATVWYVPIGFFTLGAAGGAPSLTTAYCSLGQIGGNSSVTIASLAARITTLGTTNIQLAIYNDDTTVSPHRPGTLIDSTPNIIDTATASVSGNLNATHSINPGWYWGCLQVGDITVRYQTRSTDFAESMFVGSSTLAGFLSPAVLGGVSTPTGISSFGTWPANMNGSTWNEVTSLAPMWAFQFSSVP